MTLLLQAGPATKGFARVWLSTLEAGTRGAGEGSSHALQLLPMRPLAWPQALKVDNLTSVIDERDREVQNIVQSINELAQVGARGWGRWCTAGSQIARTQVQASRAA